MAGLVVPAIHVDTCIARPSLWRLGRREPRRSSAIDAPPHGVDARHKAGHDAESVTRTRYLNAHGTSPSHPRRRAQRRCENTAGAAANNNNYDSDGPCHGVGGRDKPGHDAMIARRKARRHGTTPAPATPRTAS